MATALLAGFSRICDHCHKSFVPAYRLSGHQLRTGLPRYCSRACGAESKRLYPDAKAAKAAEYRRHHPVALHTATCIECGQTFETSQPSAVACSSACRMARTLAGQRSRYAAGEGQHQPRKCPCGAVFTPTHGSMNYCSVRCAKVAQASGSHRRRARKFGVPYEPINPIKVFERDGWRCQMCGISTPRADRGTYKPTAPELDHVVPLALGGGHLWANVQCACRACNGAKGASLQQQAA